MSNPLTQKSYYTAMELLADLSDAQDFYARSYAENSPHYDYEYRKAIEDFATKIEPHIEDMRQRWKTEKVPSDERCAEIKALTAAICKGEHPDFLLKHPPKNNIIKIFVQVGVKVSEASVVSENTNPAQTAKAPNNRTIFYFESPFAGWAQNVIADRWNKMKSMISRKKQGSAHSVGGPNAPDGSSRQETPPRKPEL